MLQGNRSAVATQAIRRCLPRSTERHQGSAARDVGLRPASSPRITTITPHSTSIIPVNRCRKGTQSKVSSGRTPGLLALIVGPLLRPLATLLNHGAEFPLFDAVSARDLGIAARHRPFRLLSKSSLSCSARHEKDV